MRKHLIKAGLIISLAIGTTLGIHVVSNHDNSAFGLTFANIEAMASDSEGGGPITDPNIALHSRLEEQRTEYGTIRARCCRLGRPEDQCNYKLEYDCYKWKN